MTNALVIRAGRVGERDTWALQYGFSGGGWNEVPDLSTCLTRDQVRAVVTQTFAGEKQATIYSFIGQMWALRITTHKPARQTEVVADSRF